MSVARLSYELKRKIEPLLRLQASDNDNERANASAAIGRLLKNNGGDWHDLTDALLAGPQVKSDHGPNSSSSSRTSWKRSAGAIDLPRGQLINLLELIEARTPFLPIKAAGFISSLRARSFRPTVHLSEKQWAWLQDLLEATGV
jgi:hypothetical protein